MRNFFKNKFVIIILLITFFSFGFLLINNVLASDATSSVITKEKQMKAFMSSSGFSETAQVEGIVSVIIRALLSFLAIIFVVLMIFSGYQWMTAGGNEEQVKKSQKNIKNAVIGLIIVILAYTITAFVFKNLPGGSQSNTAGGTGINVTP